MLLPMVSWMRIRKERLVEIAMTQKPATGSEGGRGDTLTVIYNGACPVCRLEINHYRCQAGDDLDWLDAAADATPLPAIGVEPAQAFRRLHVVDGQGRVRAGVDAFIALWLRLPRYRWLARALSTPPILTAASLLYERLIAPALYALHRRRAAKAARREAAGR